MAGSFNRFATDVAGLLEIAADALTAAKLVPISLTLPPRASPPHGHGFDLSPI